MKKIGLWALIATLSLGQLQRLQITPNIAGYVHEVFLALFAAASIRNIKIDHKLALRAKAIFLNSNTWWILWAVLLTIAASIWNMDIVPMLYLARLGLIVGGVWGIYQQFQENHLYLKRTFLALAVIWAGLGIIQLAFIPDTRFLSAFGWDDHYYRLIGPLFDPGFMGMAFVLGILLTFSPKLVPDKRIQTILVSLLTIAIALTFSRASYGALLLSLSGLFVLSRKHNPRTILISVGMFLLVLAVVPKPGGEGVKLQRTSTIIARGEQITALTEGLSLKTIIFGQGLFQIRQVTPQPANSSFELPYHARIPDNIFVTVLQGTGLVGIALLTLSLKKSLRFFQRNPLTGIALSALLFHSLFSNTLLQPFILIYFLAGFTFGINSHAVHENKDQRSKL